MIFGGGGSTPQTPTLPGPKDSPVITDPKGMARYAAQGPTAPAQDLTSAISLGSGSDRKKASMFSPFGRAA